MSDPTRLTDSRGDEVTGLERDLLRAGQQARLPARDRDQIWMGLSLQIVPPAVGAAAVSSGAKAAAAAKAAVGAKAVGAGAVVKGTILAVAIGGGSVAGYQAIKHRAAPIGQAAVTAPAPRAPESPEPFAAEPIVTPRAALPAPRTHEGASRKLASSHLAAEGRVVLEARQALRDGRFADALRALEAARVEFADGALVQEREALTIEALARGGRGADAARRARAFLRDYPGSPHAATVRAFAAP